MEIFHEISFFIVHSMVLVFAINENKDFLAHDSDEKLGLIAILICCFVVSV